MTKATVLVSPDHSRVRIDLGGEIDLENAASVEEQLAAAIPNHLSAVTLDLSGLDYIDSVGLRILFALAARLEVLQIELQVVAPIGSLARRVLELSGFEAIVALDPKRTAAS
ncbi:STAS domain-containing protein [Actinomycetospora sp. TBRC 11914]|uniref:STAS domain-containing protein n=1 Tax=Actinomycetospora sp. TBRC 11914 TaxID=2729387 RepID=UPI00145EAEB0|nr:STAS domain-containing protein [Actinomycetospora sp. TBRC 11914]NMO91307.1 STAS domain-containing protein [Actinomycetospora sp. TBRC 11914]